MRILILLLLAASLYAHDLYLSPSTFRPAPGATVRVEYHNGDSFPASEMEVEPERLRDAKLLSGGAEMPFTNFRIEGKATVADVAAPRKAGHFFLISRTIPNFIEIEPSHFEEYLRHEGLDRIIAWRKKNGESDKPGREIYSKYVKAVGLAGSRGGGYDAAAGLTIEFILLADPYQLAPGDELPVRVLLRGKPAPGLAVEASSASGGEVTKTVAGRTDENGDIRIPINRAGLWKLHTIHLERRANTEKADWESYWASLTFEVAAAGE